MLGAMRFVGAKNAIAEPNQLSSAAEVCPGAPTPAVAVLPVAASSPSGAKVRQVGSLGSQSLLNMLYAAVCFTNISRWDSLASTCPTVSCDAWCWQDKQS